MEQLLNQIKDSFLYEIIWMIIGGIIIKIYTIIYNNLLNLAIKKRIKKESIRFQQSSIVSLDHGDPFYKPENIIFSNSNMSHFINMPETYQQKILSIRPDFEIRNQNQANVNFIEHLENLFGVEIKDLIEEKAYIVAEQFYKKLQEGSTIFNGEKYGISHISSDRTGANEDSRLFIRYYKTDYFTHQVFRAVYRHLKNEDHDISKVKSFEELNKYYPFLTSLGVNALLEINLGSVREIVLAKRSKRVSNMNNSDIWHVSMNEGLSITDLEVDEVSLLKCLNRGLREELGIKEESHKHIIDKNFYDTFLNTDDFEVGITSIVRIEMDYDTIEVLYRGAQDSELETVELMKLNSNKKSMKEFLTNHNKTNACEYLLQMYMARAKGFF